MHQCNKMNDKWAERVMARIRSVHDLPVADAVYHQIYISNFRTGKGIPLAFMSDTDDQPIKKHGRQKDILLEGHFNKLWQILHKKMNHYK